MPEENKEQPPVQAQATVEFVVPDPEGGILTTYANNIQVAWTDFDVRMLFGEVVDTRPDKIIVEQRVQVTVSYLQAKLLLLMLSQVVARYEPAFGEIKIPAGAHTFNVTSTQAAVPPGASSRP